MFMPGILLRKGAVWGSAKLATSPSSINFDIGLGMPSFFASVVKVDIGCSLKRVPKVRLRGLFFDFAMISP